MAKIFVEPSQVMENSIKITDRDDLHHLITVLRIKKGEELQISDGEGWEYFTKVSEISADRVEAVILDKQKFAREPECHVTIFQGIPKSDKMEDIVQKCVELGVYEIVPVFTERTVVVDKGNFEKKIARWQKISAEAVKQCKRGIIPNISKEMRLDAALGRLAEFELVLFPYENEEHQTIKEILRKVENKPQRVAIFIGPEGGFSDGEAEKIKAAGAKCVTLGKTILRSQTAAQTALAMTLYEFEL